MEKRIGQGGTRLKGEVTVSGSKNACLPILAACLMTNEESVIHGVPKLVDIIRLNRLMGELGVKVERDRSDPFTVRLQVEDESKCLARYDLVRQMRASICVMGPLIAKRGRAMISQPGGCAIGDRPIDLHLQGLRARGAQYKLTSGGNISLRAGRLKGREMFLGGPFGSSVLATANVMSAACLAKGITVIDVSAGAPGSVELGGVLVKMGGEVGGGQVVCGDGVAPLQLADDSVVGRVRGGWVEVPVEDGRVLREHTADVRCDV